MNEVCGTCKYFMIDESIPDNENSMGWCHRFPPALAQSKYCFLRVQTGFDWCGEHEEVRTLEEVRL